MKKNIQQQKSYKILLLGDSCDDIYNYGSIERRCFEERPKGKGTPILKVKKTIRKPGMAKNVFKNFKTLEQEVDFFTNSEIIQKVRLINTSEKNTSIMRIDYNDSVESMNLSKLKNIQLEKFDCIVISDYNKGFISEEIINYIVKNFNGKIFVDSKKSNLSCYENCIIKINEYENSLVRNFPEKYHLIVTLGKNGAKWNNKHFKPYKCDKIIDICGAGDTFFASFVVCYLKTTNFEISIKVANQCASLVLEHVGNHYICANQIDEMIEKLQN
jgi:D-beta-D-heptose 7-phosphate kinase/D-beta-D-heptose 1-phosphate adenosyltransferase